MYNKIVLSLKKAKESGNNQTIKKCLKSIVGDLMSLASSKLELSTFSDFIRDESYLFQTDRMNYSQSEADLRVVGNGLLDDVLDILGIVEHHSISSAIRDGIYDLQGAISRNETDLSRLVDTLKDSICVLDLAAE